MLKILVIFAYKMIVKKKLMLIDQCSYDRMTIMTKVFMKPTMIWEILVMKMI